MKKIKLHWIHIVSILIGTVLVGSIGVGLLIQRNTSIDSWDGVLYEFFAHHYHTRIMDILVYPFNFNFLPFGGNGPVFYYFIIIPALIYLWVYKRSLVKWFIFSIVVALVIALTATYLDWQLVFRQRPFLVLPNDIPAKAAEIWGVVSSFPSGHSRDTAIIATIVATLIPQTSIFAIALTLFVGFSRVYLGAHYPTDVLAGWIIGFLSAKASLIMSRELQIIYDKRRGKVNQGVPEQSPKDVKKG